MNSTYYEGSQSNSYSLTKVFGWLFYAILLTAVTAFGIPYLLVAINAVEAYYPILITGLVAIFILSFIGQFIIARTQSKPLAITIYSLYAIAMGTWISPLVIIYDLGTLIYSLFITAGIFGIMAIYGAVTKRDLSGFGTFLIMLLLGCLVVSIFNIFFANTTVDWIISYVLLAVYIGFIAVDIQRVKRLADSNQLNLNSSLLLALNLYIDFVYVFIRVVALVGNSRRN